MPVNLVSKVGGVRQNFVVFEFTKSGLTKWLFQFVVFSFSSLVNPLFNFQIMASKIFFLKYLFWFFNSFFVSTEGNGLGYFQTESWRVGSHIS